VPPRYSITDRSDASPGQPPAPLDAYPVALRWIALTALIIAELSVTRLSLAFPDSTAQSGPVAHIIRAVDENIQISDVGSFIVAFGATFLLIVSRRLQSVFDKLLHQDSYRWWLWLVGHAACFALFFALSWPVFGPAAERSGPSLGWLAAWICAGAGSLICLLFSAAPADRWLRLALQEKAAAPLAAISGLVALAGGHLAQQLWTALTDITLWFTYNLLSALYEDVYLEPTTAILGVNSFLVEIHAQCSGLEGVALITVFVTLYLWLFRNELRFPAAFLLFPVGIIIILVTNILRIVALVSIGAFISPNIAVNGFHSQAGWIGFSLVAYAVIFFAHRNFLTVPTDTRLTPDRYPATTYASSLLTPLLVLLAISMLVTASSNGFPLLYPLNVIFTAGVIWYFRRHYGFLRSRPSWQAVAIGTVVGVIWLLIVPNDEASAAMQTSFLADMPPWLSTGWIVFRVLGSVVTVPIAEELAFRGYLLHKLVDSDFENVKPGTFAWRSFLLSSLLFGLMHDNWLAGTLAGAGFALALYQRGHLGDAIVAHIASNALIAIAVLGAGRWELWG
jgi:exosortase E/protease (VPEID-CTERM system)